MQEEEEEITSSAESLVSDVESELRERAQKAQEEATEAAADDNSSDKIDSVPYWSPPVAGGERIEKKWSNDKVELALVNELPDGTDSFRISLPSKDEFDDKTHELNRLLGLYDISPEMIGDLSGERLPLRPHGNSSNIEQMSFYLDVPPVQTTPNMLLYYVRRLSERLNLISLSHTPVKNTGFTSHSLDWNPSTGYPVMTKSAYPYFILFNQNYNEIETVITDRGAGALLLLQTGAILGLISLGPFENILLGVIIVLTLLLTIMAWIISFAYLLSAWGPTTYKNLKNRFFPKSD